MNKADKAAFKTGSIFGALGAMAIAPIATPVLWAALAYGTYKVARGAYYNAKLKDAPKDKPNEDFFV
jgi:hypothetical protein